MKKILLLACLLISGHYTIAQDADEEGCKDHPLFTRLPNFRISSCVQNYSNITARMSSAKAEDKEGNLTKLGYAFTAANENAKPPSPLQVIKNYENAIVKNGGKKVYSSTGADGFQGATFTMSAKGKDYWVTIDNMTPGLPDVCDGFELNILELEAMKQDVAASEMFEQINSSGSISLYINFETGKSTVRPDSKKIIDELAAMLKANPALKISIEGHTDNVGTPAANKVLSEARASAVMSALVSAGIDALRMSSKGWGQEKPKADNKTEEGRAKNRRVEIVKV